MKPHNPGYVKHTTPLKNGPLYTAVCVEDFKVVELMPAAEYEDLRTAPLKTSRREYDLWAKKWQDASHERILVVRRPIPKIGSLVTFMPPPSRETRKLSELEVIVEAFRVSKARKVKLKSKKRKAGKDRFLSALAEGYETAEIRWIELGQTRRVTAYRVHPSRLKGKK